LLNTADPSAAPHRRPARAFAPRLLIAVLAIMSVVGGIVALTVWYEQDRPLRNVEAAMKSGKNADALVEIGKYLKEHPQDSRAMMLKARVLVEMGRLTDAIYIFTRFGGIDIADLHAWAKAHLLRNEWSYALPILQRILQLNPNDADGLHEITACYSYLGRYQAGLETAERMSKRKGHEARAFVLVGKLHESLGNKKSAAEAWKKVLKYSPNADDLQISASDFFTAYGGVLIDEGQLPEAIAVLEEGIRRHDSAEGRLRLGEALQQNGDQETAVTSWKRAVELSPELRRARELLAEDALRERRVDEASQWLEPILSSADISSSAAYLMQRICQAKGDRAGVEKWQERTANLRQQAHIEAVVKQILATPSESFWSRALQAYRFAESGNWQEAQLMISSINESENDEPFIRRLFAAIRQRGSLPSLDLLPIHHFQ
jgi:tetratricopeptide (TPR) repeat protein